MSSMLKSRSDLIEQGMFIALSEILLTLIILSVTGYFLTRHIGKLIYFANKVTAGDYDIKPGAAGGDEFGVMAKTFATMANTIKERIEELHKSENALSRSKAEFEAIFSCLAGAVIFVDRQRRVLFTNNNVEAMFGYSPESLHGKTLEFLYKNPAAYLENAVKFNENMGEENSHFVSDYVRKNGEEFTGETVLSVVCDAEGELLGFVGIVRDITEQLAAHRALAEETERVQVTLQSIGDAVITTNTSGEVVYLNPVAEKITGWSLQDAIGKPLQDVFYIVNEISRLRIESPVERCLKEQRIIDMNDRLLLLNKEGREYFIEDSAAPIRNHDGEVFGAVLVFHDVTKSRAMSQQLVWQATHDSLTGLLNRNHFESNLRRLLVDAEKHQHQHAMLYLDLDQFKLVNDTCGHIAGDELLRQLSRLLQSQLRDTDNLARLGGDEFGILLDNQSHEEVDHVAERLRRMVDEYVFVWKEKSFRVGISIGVVYIDSESKNLTSVLSEADMACYIAKDSGRNRIHVHTPDDKEVALRHGEMHWVAKINEALKNDSFALYVQQIKSLKNNAHPHYEILIRLPSMGEIIMPMAFIPAAERYNLMPKLDRWVVAHTFKWLREDGKDYEGVLTINLSGTTLSDKDFLPYIISELTHSDINPSQICFEITETAAISNLGLAIGFINEVKRQGAFFALDDFGSGLSSFNYLKNLPVDYLKIDGSFVRDIDRDLISYTMVESICHVGRVMGLKMIAEFVENESILKKVEELGIDYAQGYGIHKPEPLINLMYSQSISS
ncbi:MAG: EAL domain-containing protein [Gammaproteobacteria bacterium]|nr:EAL domain-containing protein [Gammaproteobacteria bacterium]